MSSELPKYLVCKTYDPQIDPPAFVPGPAPCSLISADERRSRGSLGDVMFFRSKEPGEVFNDITVTTTWLDAGYVHTTAPENVSFVQITFTHGAISFYVYVTQTYDPFAIPPDPSWTLGNLLFVETLVNTHPSNTFVEAFAFNTTGSDVQYPWPPAVLPTEPFFIEESITLSGGDSGPANPTGIRSGPIYVLSFIRDSERNQPTGTMVSTNIKQVWDGTQWVLLETLVTVPIDGSVQTFADLPTTTNGGEVYYVNGEDEYYEYNGAWNLFVC